MRINLNKFQEPVKNRAAWSALVYGVTKCWTRLSNWGHTYTHTHKFTHTHIMSCHLQITKFYFFFFFQSGSHLFIFLLWLPWLRLSKVYQIIVASVDIIVLFLILEEMICIFQLWKYCLWWICHVGLYYVEVGSFYVSFLDIFKLQMEVEFCQKFYLHQLRWSYCFPTLSFLIWLIYVYWTVIAPLG